MSFTKKKSNTIVDKEFQSLLTANIIITPCEKVLSILKQVKNYLAKISKDHAKLIQNLDWCIKVIASRSLYSYEMKEKETINNLSKKNQDLKQLVDFISEYNEKVIEMNRKYNILTDKLLQKSSVELVNRRKIERKNSFEGKDNMMTSKLLTLELLNQNSENTNNNNNNTTTTDKSIGNEDFNPIKKTSTVRNFIFGNFINTLNSNSLNKGIIKKENKNPFNEDIVEKSISLQNSKNPLEGYKSNRINKINNSYDTNNKLSIKKFNKKEYEKKKAKKEKKKLTLSFNENYSNKKSKNLFPSIQKISITINNETNTVKDITAYSKSKKPIKPYNTLNSVNISLTNSIVCSNNENNNTNNNNNINENKIKKEEKSNIYKFAKISKSKKNIPHIKDYSYVKIQSSLIHNNYDISKLITEKNFDIFNLRNLIGYNNVLPMIGRTILENLGLLDEEILNTSKLDNFLISVSNKYNQQTLYHNSLHGSDVTQSLYIFFTHSNAEKIAKTNVLDLLSIIIAALGHDIGHPGFTNTFQINDSTDLALTYNDISVLENFHASTLFKTLRKSDNNIFETITPIDYKIIRKRMISEILATDMANHGRVISLIKSKIILNKDNNAYKLNLFSGNEQNKSDEQQSLLDFMLHLADLAHNAKVFTLSKQWVELLTEEFWRQGDIEREKNLPISFLCDRQKIDVPKSQIGFITGYIIPTFEVLSTVFPTLKYTIDNSNNNLKEWQKLMDEGRKTGWTPPKNQKEKKVIKDKIFRNSINKGKVNFGGFSTFHNDLYSKDKNENKNDHPVFIKIEEIKKNDKKSSSSHLKKEKNLNYNYKGKNYNNKSFNSKTESNRSYTLGNNNNQAKTKIKKGILKNNNAKINSKNKQQ